MEREILYGWRKSFYVTIFEGNEDVKEGGNYRGRYKTYQVILKRYKE